MREVGDPGAGTGRRAGLREVQDWASGTRHGARGRTSSPRTAIPGSTLTVGHDHTWRGRRAATRGAQGATTCWSAGAGRGSAPGVGITGLTERGTGPELCPHLDGVGPLQRSRGAREGNGRVGGVGSPEHEKAGPETSTDLGIVNPRAVHFRLKSRRDGGACRGGPEPEPPRKPAPRSGVRQPDRVVPCPPQPRQLDPGRSLRARERDRPAP